MSKKVIALLFVIVFGAGVITGISFAGQPLVDYVQKEAEQTAQLTEQQAEVITKTEIVYRDRIQKIYIKGETIEKQVPVYITVSDNDRYGVNAGFVRLYNAAWQNSDTGSAKDFDREPAGIPLSDIAEVNAHNAKSCLAWREIALGTREAYQAIQSVVNGKN